MRKGRSSKSSKRGHREKLCLRLRRISVDLDSKGNVVNVHKKNNLTREQKVQLIAALEEDFSGINNNVTPINKYRHGGYTGVKRTLNGTYIEDKTAQERQARIASEVLFLAKASFLARAFECMNTRKAYKECYPPTVVRTTSGTERRITVEKQRLLNLRLSAAVPHVHKREYRGKATITKYVAVDRKKEAPAASKPALLLLPPPPKGMEQESVVRTTSTTMPAWVKGAVIYSITVEKGYPLPYHVAEWIKDNKSECPPMVLRLLDRQQEAVQTVKRLEENNRVLEGTVISIQERYRAAKKKQLAADDKLDSVALRCIELKDSLDEAHSEINDLEIKVLELEGHSPYNEQGLLVGAEEDQSQKDRIRELERTLKDVRQDYRELEEKLPTKKEEEKFAKAKEEIVRTKQLTPKSLNYMFECWARDNGFVVASKVVYPKKELRLFANDYVMEKRFHNRIGEIPHKIRDLIISRVISRRRKILFVKRRNTEREKRRLLAMGSKLRSLYVQQRSCLRRDCLPQSTEGEAKLYEHWANNANRRPANKAWRAEYWNNVARRDIKRKTIGEHWRAKARAARAANSIPKRTVGSRISSVVDSINKLLDHELYVSPKLKERRKEIKEKRISRKKERQERKAQIEAKKNARLAYTLAH